MGKRNVLFLSAVTILISMSYACSGPYPGDGDRGGSPVASSGGPVALATGSISGKIVLPDRVLADADNRDPNNPSTSNNSLALAQAISSPATVVGNVNSAIDPQDFFSTTLAAGETVKLLIADQTANLDLYLYQNGTQVSSSTGAGKISEYFIISGTGSYKIEVRAVTGGSNYQLQIGTTAATPASAGEADAPAGDFVAGEVLVKVKTPSGAAPVGSSALTAQRRNRAGDAARRHNVQVGEMDPEGLSRMKFDTGVADNDINAPEERRHRTLAKVKELRADPEVEYAEPNFIAYPLAVPNDTDWSQQWNLRLLNLPKAWDLTIGSPAVIVAVVDTGVLYDHPDLTANILRDGSRVVGYDMISSTATANDGNGPDPDPYDSGDEVSSTQSSYHGTHVAGIIGAAGNNALGVAGTAWSVRIMPVRVLGKNGGTDYDVAQGIRYAAGVSNAYDVYPTIAGVRTRADVINLSLGQPSFSQTMQDAINAARSAGVTVVAAAGNDSSSTNFYPAACAGVIGVSAVGPSGVLAYYSNSGPSIDLAAPGGDKSTGQSDGIYSTLAAGLNAPSSFNYVYYQGTSMASPHVAGVIALMKAYFAKFAPAGSKLTPEMIDSLIKGTAPGVPGSITNYALGARTNSLGYGLLDAEKALQAAGILAGNSTPTGALLALQPAEVDFGFTGATQTVSIVSRGSTPPTGVAVAPYSSTWLSHTLSGTALTLKVNRNSLAYGNYQATITVTSSNAGSATLTVRISTGAAVTANVGHIYVVALNTRSTSQWMVGANSAGNYAYAFSSIRKGPYILMAGTDLDNDGYIGDNGEFAGLYPGLSTPQAIRLKSGQILTGRDFALQPVTNSTFVFRHN